VDEARRSRPHNRCDRRRPQLVNSFTDLKNVSLDLGGNYVPGTNIDASTSSDGSYVPLGNAATPFTGQFDGQGYAISSLTLQAWTPPQPL
jgi:hypothetical protein